MSNPRHWAVVAAAALFLPLMPLADAAVPRVVPSIVVDELGYADYGAGTWVLRFNVTFELSPDDSRAGGNDTAVRYDLCGFAQQSDVATVNAGHLDGYTCGVNITAYAIPGRSPWAWTSVDDTTDTCVGNGTANPSYCSTVPPMSTWNISAYDAGGSRSVSCGVTIDYRSINRLTNAPQITNGVESTPLILFPWGGDGTDGSPSTYNACGSNATLRPPSGVTARATTPYGPLATDPATTEVAWAPSPDDNQTAPYMDYYWFPSASMPRVDRDTTYCRNSTTTVNCFQCTGIYACTLCAATFTCQQLTCQPGAVACGRLVYRGFDAGSVSGVYRLNATARRYKNDPHDGISNVLYSTVIARDNLTHQQSTFSCYVNVQGGSVGSADACGDMNAFGVVPIGGPPVFPFIDVPQQAGALGLSISLYGLVLGILLVGGLAALGGMLAGRFGGVVLGAIGLGVAYSFNTVAGWVVVLLFALCVLAVVLRLQRGGQVVG